jgi:glutamate formiminotransferase / 5-formyltetrahydrofolate cyclo-ligase
MVPVLEAVPNFSAGRDEELLRELTRVAEEEGAEVLDASSDADHNRSVVTLLGAPREVEEATVRMAEVAARAIDLREHRGVHPRIGALDVLPFVPLSGLTMDDARESAHRVGARLAREVGLPVYFYALASDPPGRPLSELRRGGFEALASGLPPERTPDLLPPEWSHPGIHPSAGAVCVGARPLLLAWNVDVEGLAPAELTEVAAELRESGGGLSGVRALGLVLRDQGRMQISMNLEDVGNHSPFKVFRALEDRVAGRGGRVVATEVIGMIPDELVFGAGADRLALLDRTPSRVLSSRLAEHLARRAGREALALVRAVEEAGEEVPPRVREAAQRLGKSLIGPKVRDDRI